MTTMRRWLLVVFVALAGAFSLGGAALAWFAYRTWDGGWHTHRDPGGFTVELPRGWTARPDPVSGRIEIAGNDGERVTVWPLFSSAALDARSARTLLVRLASRLWPGARWTATEALGDHALRMRGEASGRRGACLLTWVTTPRGTSASVSLVSAPAGRVPEVQARFARILRGFRLSGPPVAALPPAPRYVRWQDPREHAFSADVPTGWRVDGGAMRPGLLLVQARLEAASPDGGIAMHMGDAFPVYTEPSPLLAMAGIGPGGTYVDAMGQGTPVAAYVPGVDYALRSVVPRRVGAIRLLSRKERPDVARRLPTAGINRYDAGEAEYRFTRNGREGRGWALCITERVAAPQTTLWHVWRLYLVEADASRFDEGADALSRMVASFRIDPVWAERQARLTAEQSRIITDMGQTVSRIAAEAHEGRQRRLDEIHRRGANARREVEQLIDPATGREMTVASGSRYYWVDPRGNVVGTSTDTRPDLDFRELVQLL